MTTTISVPAHKLRLMLTAVLPHAQADDDTMPGLMAVRFEVQGGTLYLAATDRYTMGAARCRIPGMKTGSEVAAATALHVDAAAGLLSALAGETGVAALTFEDGGKLGADLGETGSSYETVAERFTEIGLGDWFPDWRATLGGLLNGDAAQLESTMAVNPVLLARFAVSLDSRDEATDCAAPLRMRMSRSEAGITALLVTRDNWFAGALMPYRRIRRADDTLPPDEFEDWAAVLAQGAEVPGA